LEDEISGKGHYERLYNSPEAASFLSTLPASVFVLRSRDSNSCYGPVTFVCSDLALGNERICRLAYAVSKLIESLDPRTKFCRFNPDDSSGDSELKNATNFHRIKHFGMVYSTYAIEDEFFISFNAVNQAINENIRATQLIGPQYQILSEVKIQGDLILAAIHGNAASRRNALLIRLPLKWFERFLGILGRTVAFNVDLIRDFLKKFLGPTVAIMCVVLFLMWLTNGIFTPLEYDPTKSRAVEKEKERILKWRGY
jgi:hypothetical protein